VVVEAATQVHLMLVVVTLVQLILGVTQVVIPVQLILEVTQVVIPVQRIQEAT
jgi:hypothetical protein